jgi:hypothetical protein
MSQPGSKISVGLSHRELPNKAYQSTRAFNSGAGALYTYTRSLNGNYQTVGSLNINAGSTANNCPIRRVVHANGKVLIPGVHPGGGAGVSPATGTGSTTPNPLPFPMIGVYDPVSGLNGYINPQDSTWAEYSASLSAFYDDGRTSADSVLGGQGAEPRFGRVFAGAASVGPAATVDIGSAHTGTIASADAATTTSIVVTSADVTASSIVLLTMQGATASARVSALTNGSFTITPSAALGASDKVHFVIIN